MKNPDDLGSVMKNITNWAGLEKEWRNGDCTLVLMRFVSASWNCINLHLSCVLPSSDKFQLQPLLAEHIEYVHIVFWTNFVQMAICAFYWIYSVSRKTLYAILLTIIIFIFMFSYNLQLYFSIQNLFG